MKLNLFKYHELIAVLAWKSIIVRYKQSYLGLIWAILKPVSLMMIFMLVRSFVGIDTENIPYPILTFAALTPWIFFQESTSEGINSVTSNAALVKKIYFPREIFPLTVMVSKLIELAINLAILLGLMLYYDIPITIESAWVPFIILYTMLAALSLSLIGSALNVFYRDVASALPILLSLGMYVSPVIYPLSLVKDKLLTRHAAGEWSEDLYRLYASNPLTGIIDSFQRVLLQGLKPDFELVYPGFILTMTLLVSGWLYFKKAEDYFTDVI